jgi:hypothetical protein
MSRAKAQKGRRRAVLVAQSTRLDHLMDGRFQRFGTGTVMRWMLFDAGNVSRSRKGLVAAIVLREE